MDRRLFLTGLVGVGATTAVACVLSPQAQALVTVPPGKPLPSHPDGLPDLTAPGLDLDATAPEFDDGDIEYVSHRRRRRVRRWRRHCRRYWHNGYWRRRCRRVPFWAWIWISI